MIKELCDRHGVSCVYTSKLFFGRFTSSVTISFPADQRAEHERAANKIREDHGYVSAASCAEYQTMLSALRYANGESKADRQVFIDGLIRRFPATFLRTTEYRMGKVSVTFYLDDPTSLAALINADLDIVKVSIPRNEGEVAFLKANTDKIIQDKYYFNQYPFKITFKNAFNHDYLKQYVADQFGGDDGSIDVDRAYFYKGAAPSESHLYLTYFEDVFLTKIGVQELIEKVQEVVLRD